MKRKLLCGLLCLLLLSGCFAVDAFAAKLDSKDVDWGLTLRVDEISPTGITVVLIQSGGSCEGDLEYGSYYHLERLTKEGWKSVSYLRNDIGWTLEAYGIPPESICRMEKNWERLYGELPNGHYRFVKEFTDFRGSGDYDEADFYVEFVIAAPHTCVSEDQDLLCDICLGIAPHDCMDGNGDTECDICGQKVSDQDVFRVIGNADWLGNWDPAFEGGRMIDLGNGHYRKSFADVPPGCYEIKITKDGKWENAYGSEDGMNYTFSVRQSCTVTVDFVLNGDVGVISLTGPYYYDWDDGDEQEENPKSADLPMELPVVLMLACAVTLSLMTVRRKRAV